ncbi:MAG TPA: hypothetical protein VLH12_08650 [Usitatibacter sp.]|nr:hypothetical protein [Usitatibacter sp.]
MANPIGRPDVIDVQHPFNPIARSPGGPNVHGRGPGPIPNARHTPIVQTRPPPQSSVPDAGVLNSTGTSAEVRQQQIVAENALLRIIYGRQSLGAQIADVIFFGGNLVIFAVWGHGPVNAIENVYLDDKVSSSVAGVAVTNYTGTQVVADPTLVAAYAAQSPAITYGDILPNIAYSVIVLPPGVTTGFPRINAVVQGLLVYDPRSATTGYSDNAALALADLEVNATYGAARSVDWTTVATTADACDALVGGTEKRRTIGLVIDQVSGQWFETLRAYAGCFLARSNGALVLIPDRPTASSFTFSEVAGNCRAKNVKRRSTRDVPTVCGVRYTDTSVWPWRDDIAYVYADGVLAGTVPWKMREVAMPGITRKSQAIREATEQMNKLKLTDFVCDIEAQDEALAVTIGDVVTLTANVGVSAQLCRVVSPTMPSLGRPVFSVEGYNAAVYSDSVTTGSAVVDTTLPSAGALSQPTGLIVTETIYIERTGGSMLAAGLIYQSRFDCTWTAPASSYPVTYRVEIWDGTTKIRDEQVTSTSYSSPALQQGKTYLVKVFSRNTITESPFPASASLLAAGKVNPPGPVPSITRAFEVGGKVILAWDAATDIDTVRYEWRYFPNGTGTWETATLIDRVDGLTAAFDALPVGTHRFYVRAIDSVGAYSTSSSVVDISVTSDSDAFIQDREFTSPTLTNMVEIGMVEGIWKRRWLTSVAGQTWNAGITGTVNAVAGPVVAVHASGASTWQGESWDLGEQLSGQITLTTNATAVSGSFTSSIDTSLDGSTWTSNPGVSANVNFRFIRPTISTPSGTDTLLISAPPKISLSVLSRSESGVVTTSASVATLVQLTGGYSFAQDLQVTPANTTSSRSAVWDRLIVHPQTGLELYGEGAGTMTYKLAPAGGQRTIASGDTLTYDVYIDPASPAATTTSDGGFVIVFTDTTTTGALNDADGFNSSSPAVGFDALARGQWKTRSVVLTTLAGKTTDIAANQAFRIRLDSTGSGAHTVLFRNVKITNAGSTVLNIYSTGDPLAVQNNNAGGYVNFRVGPTNSFNVYCFNSTTGAQVANDVRWSFRGF